MTMQTFPSGLYLIATPIGNMGDMTARAIETLRHLDVLYCEDTRITGALLHALGVTCKMLPYDDHHAAEREGEILTALAGGKRVGLCSDAGMPLISDPGYKLVRAVAQAGHYITSLPGANAVLTALQLSALPTDRFTFQGFLPPKATARREVLGHLANVPVTLVFYETAPRIADALADMLDCFGDRQASLIRELTKKFEEVRRGTLSDLLSGVASNPPRGELVVVVGGADKAAAPVDNADIATLVQALLPHYPTRQVADMVAAATGQARREVYDMALRLKETQA